MRWSQRMNVITQKVRDKVFMEECTQAVFKYTVYDDVKRLNHLFLMS